jgi:hypothetical protein
MNIIEECGVTIYPAGKIPLDPTQLFKVAFGLGNVLSHLAKHYFEIRVVHGIASSRWRFRLFRWITSLALSAGAAGVSTGNLAKPENF